MALTSGLAILQHLETQLKTITKLNGYHVDIQSVDREFVQRNYDSYPFVFVNDIDSKYVKRICKNLYKKALIIQIAGYVYKDATTATPAAQLGTALQEFKDDITKCLAASTFFNDSDKELQILDVSTDGYYRPPQACLLVHLAVTHYEDR